MPLVYSHFEASASMRGQDACGWLVRGSTELCGRSCLKEYCKVHLMQLRRGGRLMRPCLGCGCGISNVIGYCQRCNYHNIEAKLRMRRNRAFTKEVQRLEAIDISI